MPDPSKHVRDRNLLERIIGSIPGFHGYLQKEHRREADALTRKWLADELDQNKLALDTYIGSLVDAGKLSEITQFESLRTKTNKLVGRLRSAPRGYSGFFDYVKVREDLLDKIYEHDLSLINETKKLSQLFAALSQPAESPALQCKALSDQVQQIDKLFNLRGEMLAGIAEG